MRWSEDGRSVLIATEGKFPAHLLSRLSTKSYASLIRRLYYYGFHKVGGVYRHDLFICGQPSSIQPNRRMSHGASPPSFRHNGSSQRGPRYKVIKRKRARDSVWDMHGFERSLVVFDSVWNWSPTLTGIAWTAEMGAILDAQATQLKTSAHATVGTTCFLPKDYKFLVELKEKYHLLWSQIAKHFPGPITWVLVRSTRLSMIGPVDDEDYLEHVLTKLLLPMNEAKRLDSRSPSCY